MNHARMLGIFRNKFSDLKLQKRSSHEKVNATDKCVTILGLD